MRIGDVRFQFATAGRIVFGPGTLSEAGPIARNLGGRALVVTGGTPGRAEPLLRVLSEHGVEAVIFPVAGEPRLDTVLTGTEVARRERCDQVIACGGGSAIDTGKAIAAMLTNPGELLDYVEIVGRGQELTRSPAPFMAIPTTAGTGSEVTRNAVLAAPEHRAKVSLRSPLMLPKVALVDPELTYDLPPDVTATTGMDALAQLIEPFVSTRANPMTDGLCLEGIERVARSLPRAVHDGRDEAAREDMAIASLFGGLALANAGLGAVHGLAGPLGGMHPVPHGAVCAALLPPVVEANLRALRERAPQSEALVRYRRVAILLTGRGGAAAEDAVQSLRDLVAELRVPPLGSYGVPRDAAAELAEKAARASSMRANPVTLTLEELTAIFVSAL
jgi:alcohol dehydrogenase class IV